MKRTHDHDGGESAAKKPRIEELHVQKVREQLAARLDAPKEASVTVDNIKYAILSNLNFCLMKIKSAIYPIQLYHILLAFDIIKLDPNSFFN